MNSRGQFSIIAALLVAVVLIGTVITTYATLRYSIIQDQPQVLSAIDETNLALEKVLGFTVGYYGSVLQVTGDTSYAKSLTTTYLNNSLSNIADIQPEWGASFRLASLDLSAKWFTNASYSAAQAVVTYDLPGLGISGMSYSASCRLDVQVLNSSFSSEACLNVTKDGNEPLINLGKQNFKFYRYQYSNLTWDYETPSGELTAFANGTYLIDIPSGIDPSSFVVQVTDTRGIMVAAASFSRITSTLMWNTTTPRGPDYVDSSTINVGAQSNFTAQQYGPDSIFDTLTEGAFGTVMQNYYPTYWQGLGSTTLVSGTIADLQSDNGAYMTFHSYGTAFSGTTNFGQTTTGTGSSTFSSIRGARYTCTSGGLANSITAYLDFTPSTTNLGNTGTSTTTYTSIADNITGQRIQTPASQVYVQSISAYIYCSSAAKNMKAAIYDNNGNLKATTNEISVSTGTSTRTFTFSSPPLLEASTYYVLVVWSASGSGYARLYASSSSSGVGRSYALTYGSWPNSITFSTNTNNYEIYCSYFTPAKAQCAIYSSDGGSRLGVTDEVTLASSTGSWVTFPFTTKPILSASTDYVLMAWSSDSSNVDFYYASGTAERFQSLGTVTYPTWPSTVADQSSTRNYCIYCTYTPANEYTCEVEFTGTSNTDNWNNLTWAIDSSASTSGVNVTLQLYNYQTGQYPASGDGYMTDTIGTSDLTKTQTITANPTNFRNSTGYWKLKFKAVKSTSTQFDMNLDLVKYSPVSSEIPNYALDIEEQWAGVNYAYPRQDLCIKTGNLSLNESVMVDAWSGSSWITVISSLQPNTWNNVSVTPYINSPNFTMRFTTGSSDISDPNQDSWDIDAVLLCPQPDIDVLLSKMDHTIVVELLQNGTMRWLGQNLQLTTQEKPIPPVPVKAIHVNQTINGVNQEVPFQVEDWASEYRIPLGLTNNATVFSNRQMIVFLVNVSVSKVTVWWNGSDTATQTPLAYTPTYFAGDDQDNNRLTNGKLALQFGSSFTVTSTVGSTSSTANFMRINNEASTYGAGLAYVIHHGIVRDIVQQEAEWGTAVSGIGGADNCPNVYANIVLTLPAKATYYTYQLRLMFINSTQPRNITDLCPINLTTSVDQLQTENGTVNGIPIVANGSGNFSSSVWAHHWSQFISGTQGAGIMFTDAANQQLYAFDSISGNSTGALKTNNSTKTIELLPVTLRQVQFTYALDVTWHGAVATFDGTATPIYTMQGTAPTGLWLLVEYPPKITVTSES